MNCCNSSNSIFWRFYLLLRSKTAEFMYWLTILFLYFTFFLLTSAENSLKKKKEEIPDPRNQGNFPEKMKTFLKHMIQDSRLKMQYSRSFMFMYLCFGSKAKSLTVVEFWVTQKNNGWMSSWMKILKNRDRTPRSSTSSACKFYSDAWYMSCT